MNIRRFWFQLSILTALVASFALHSCGGSGGNALAPTDATYSIGGIVSGLSGTGLAIQNNSGDDLGITSSGTFTFVTKLANGVAYHVTVKDHPIVLTQTCTTSGSTGTVAGANVSSVLVSCATRTYSVGGTVSGLTGTGLSLLNNGVNSLAIASSGTFTFGAWIADGALYSVTVGTQPSAPAQTCVVSNGSGTMNAARITNVSVACTTTPLADGSVCSSDGNCASGKCECADGSCATKRCGVASCPCKFVNLSGVCTGNLTVWTDPLNACPNYQCNGAGACISTCISNIDCDADSTCFAGVCVFKSPLGSICAAGFDCMSGFCADTHCCESSCSGGTCDSSGNCTGLPKGVSCSATDQCGAGLFCDASGTAVCCESQCGSLLGTCTGSGDCTNLPLGAVCSAGDAQCANGGGICPGGGTCP